MSENIKIKGKNPYDVLAFTLTQKCSAQCEKQVSLFTVNITDGQAHPIR